jgi:hypothetical protein
MTAWESPGKVAVQALVEERDFHEATAEIAVKTVFEHLAEPDRDMLEAGAAEIAQSLPKGARRAYARQLAAIIWRAMIERARP